MTHEVEINGITLKATPASTDELEIQETGGGLSKKVTIAGIAANLPATTITSGNLTLTDGQATLNESANNDTFLVKNTNASFANALVFGDVTRLGSTAYDLLRFRTNVGGSPVEAFRARGDGSLAISGALSKGSGSFHIDHPLKPDTHQLVHSFTESPQADLLYSGVVSLVDGKAEVNIDSVSGMTEGTFQALCRNVRTFTNNETDWANVRGSVSGNILTIECEDTACTDTISWLVIGERQDQHMFDTAWTDNNGNVIVEPIKPVPPEPTQRTVRVPVMDGDKQKTELANIIVPESIVLIDGIPTLIAAHEDEKLQDVFDIIGLVDQSGNPVMEYS